MNYWILVDLILVALVAVSVYTGWRKGFVKSALFLLALGIALVAGLYLTGRTTAKLSDKYITPWVEQTVTNMIEKRENSEQIYDYLDRGKSTVDSMWEKIKAKLVKSDESGEETETEDEEPADAGEEAEEKTPVRWMSGIIGRIIGGTLLFIIFFSAVLAILLALIEYLNFIDRIPIVGMLNKIGGLLLGFAVGAAIIAAPVYVAHKMLPSFLANLDIFTVDNFSGSRVISLVIKLLSK